MKKTLMMLITITMIISSALPASAALTGSQTDSITMERIGNHLIYTQVVPINRYLTVDGTRIYVAYGEIQLGIVKLELDEKLPLVPEKFLLEVWKNPGQNIVYGSKDVLGPKLKGDNMFIKLNPATKVITSWKEALPERGYNKLFWTLLALMIITLVTVIIMTVEYDFLSTGGVDEFLNSWRKLALFVPAIILLIPTIIILSYSYAWYIFLLVIIAGCASHKLIRKIYGLKSDRQKIKTCFRAARKNDADSLKKAKRMAGKLKITQYYHLRRWEPWPFQRYSYTELYNYFIRKVVNQEIAKSSPCESVDDFLVSNMKINGGIKGIIKNITVRHYLVSKASLARIYKAVEKNLVTEPEIASVLNDLMDEKESAKSSDSFSTLQKNTDFLLDITIRLLKNPNRRNLANE